MSDSSSPLELPPFCTKRPRAWFARAEESFKSHSIDEDGLKFNHVVVSLDRDALSHVCDLVTSPPEEDKYTAIKNRLLSAFVLSEYQRATALLNMPDLIDGELPSAMMDKMLALLDEDKPCFLFKGLFLLRLPQDIRMILSLSEEEDPRRLAKEADRLYLIGKGLYQENETDPVSTAGFKASSKSSSRPTAKQSDRSPDATDTVTTTMGGLMGKSKKPESRITEQDQAILKLKKQRDELKKYQKRINGVLDRDRELAKKLLKEGRKERALLLLRKKKYQEGLLARTDGQLDNLERLVHDLEFAQVEKQVLDGLKTGNAALKRANEMFSIEEIEAIMDETEEAVEKQREIDALLSGQLSTEDEEAALEELDRMVAEADGDADAEKEEERVPELPEAPTDELPKEKQRQKEKSPKGRQRVAMEAT